MRQSPSWVVAKSFLPWTVACSTLRSSTTHHPTNCSGFADVSKDYMLQSYHQSAECFEIVFNKAKFDALAPELQAIIKYAAEASSADMSWKAMDRYSTDLAALKEAGVKVHKTPDSVLQAQLAAWDKVLAAQSAEPFFAKVARKPEGLGQAGCRSRSSSWRSNRTWRLITSSRPRSGAGHLPPDGGRC